MTSQSKLLCYEECIQLGKLKFFVIHTQPPRAGTQSRESAVKHHGEHDIESLRNFGNEPRLQGSLQRFASSKRHFISIEILRAARNASH